MSYPNPRNGTHNPNPNVYPNVRYSEVQDGYGLQGAYGPTQPHHGPYSSPPTNPYPAVPVMINQPINQNVMQGGSWMNTPQNTINCPPGLEYLTMIDHLLVAQKVELMEALTGLETGNRYTIKNSLGQKVYYAIEETECMSKNGCGPLRPFRLRIVDNFNNPVIYLHRPLACDSCFFPCCLQSIEVSSPPGNVIGSVEQIWSIWNSKFVIKNVNGEIVLRIEGPMCTFKMCRDIEFRIMTSDGFNKVGKISKQWSGLAREVFTDADYFGITFPIDLDVKMKAVMLGACFLIDAMFFDKPVNSNQTRRSNNISYQRT